MPIFLKNYLKKAGFESTILNLANNTKLLILPYGGRILGLFHGKNPHNFFWTSPVLYTPNKLKSLVQDEQWLNPGGDRTWIAPEKEFFFPDYPKMDQYVHPQGLESIRYRLIASSRTATLTNNFNITNYASKEKIRLNITKTVLDVCNPLRFEKIKNYEFSGYGLKTHLEITKPVKTKNPLGLWSLLQLPHNGTMIISTFSKANPVCYFGKIPKNHINTQNTRVEYSMKAKGIQKIGVGSLSCTGRIGYIYKQSDHYCLIIRNFRVNPSAKYIDTPWKGSKVNQKPVYAVQVCNVNSDIGCFSEMEYHSPAINQSGCYDISQLWAFRGSRNTIGYIKDKLLTSDNYSYYAE